MKDTDIVIGEAYGLAPWRADDLTPVLRVVATAVEGRTLVYRSGLGEGRADLSRVPGLWSEHETSRLAAEEAASALSDLLDVEFPWVKTVELGYARHQVSMQLMAPRAAWLADTLDKARVGTP